MSSNQALKEYPNITLCSTWNILGYFSRRFETEPRGESRFSQPEKAIIPTRTMYNCRFGPTQSQKLRAKSQSRQEPLNG